MCSTNRILLNPSAKCDDVLEFENELRKRVVGQEEAVVKITEVVQRFMSGLNDFNKPVGNLLLLGPTGTGKTRIVESVCEVLFADPRGLVHIDCGEFKHSHEMAKITGAPPGYVGHSETRVQITQEKLDRTHNENVKLSILLFDEIEKAHEDFWDLLLGILGRGKFTDSHGNTLDLTNTIIFMTSNLGAREVVDNLNGRMGFMSGVPEDSDKISLNAATKRFSPEFMNRLDHVITFKHLDEKALSRILDIEKNKIQDRLLASPNAAKFVFTLSEDAKSFLLRKGTDKKYGARFLQRTLSEFIVNPLCNIILTSQVRSGDIVEVDIENEKLIFHRVITTEHIGG